MLVMIRLLPGLETADCFAAQVDTLACTNEER